MGSTSSGKLAMSRNVLIAIGVVLFVIGAVWTLQGLDVLGGSAMSGVTMWAVVGPVVAVVGAGLAIAGYRRHR